MKLARRDVLLVSLSLFLPFAAAPRAQQADGDVLSFLVIGDWGDDQAAEAQKAVASTMARVAEARRVSFVISTGDNFYEDGVTSPSDPKWKHAFADIYDAPSLQVPWYAVLGNHDHKGNIEAEIDYGRIDRRWIMPDRRFSVTEERGTLKADFFFLDTQVIKQDNWFLNLLDREKADQLAWLEDALSKSTARWKFVVGHHPLFSGGEHGDNSELSRVLKPVFDRHGVNAYLAGHDHDLEALEADGVAYLVSGAGSRQRPVKAHPRSRFAAAERGFLLVELSVHGGRATFFDSGGGALFTEDLPSPASL